MLLTNFFTIVKYGANIFLAIMGFISFEDINQETIHTIEQNHPQIENVNYVEKLQPGELLLSEALSYADFNYLVEENEYKDALFANQVNNPPEKRLSEFETQCEDYIAASEDFFMIAEKNIKDIEIKVLQKNNIRDIKALFKVIEVKNITQNAANSLKTYHISYSTSCN